MHLTTHHRPSVSRANAASHRIACAMGRGQVNLAETPPYGNAQQSPIIPESSLPETFDWSNVDGVRGLSRAQMV